MFGRFFSAFMFVLAVAAAAAAAAAPRQAGSSAANAAAPRPFVVYDAIGDAAAVPDITSVAVARDSQNRLTFAINVASHPSMKRGDMFSIGIDADRRLGTGSHGVDVFLALSWGSGDKEPSYSVGNWDGSEWQELDASAEVVYLAHGPRFSVAGSDIGVGRSFRFTAHADRLASSNAATLDRAPGTGLASVALRAPAEIAEMGRLSIPMLAFRPEAGKILRVRGIEIAIAKDQTEIAPGISIGSMVKPEKTRCTVKMGQTLLKTVGACAWRVPSTARGKRLTLQVSVAYRGDEWTGVYPLNVQ